MTPAELERYLTEHIPLTGAMGLRVRECSDNRIVLSAPLDPNVNHRQTAFGGSIGALATVAAWSWLHVDSQGLEFAVRLVIRANRIEYLRPIHGEFFAYCNSPQVGDYDAYHQSLRRKGRGRIEMGVAVMSEGELAATFAGTFVAMRHDEA